MVFIVLFYFIFVSHPLSIPLILRGSWGLETIPADIGREAG